MSLLAFADIAAQFERDKKLKAEDVAKLNDWQRLQPHLPVPLHPIETVLFLHSCYYSNEAAKKCIDRYYTFRTHYTEFFAKRDHLCPEFQLALKTYISIMLPDLTPEGYLVSYTRLHDRNPDVYNYGEVTKIFDMVYNMTIKQRDCCNGYVGIFDFEGATISHLLKTNVLSVKRALTYAQTALPIRIKSIHLVNAVPFMDKILALARPFLSKELQDIIYVHYGDNATIFKFVPKDILPVECGGTKMSAAEYYVNVTRKDILNHAEYFRREESQLVDETKRPEKSQNDNELFGTDGTFKKMDID